MLIMLSTPLWYFIESWLSQPSFVLKINCIEAPNLFLYMLLFFSHRFIINHRGFIFTLIHLFTVFKGSSWYSIFLLLYNKAQTVQPSLCIRRYIILLWNIYSCTAAMGTSCSSVILDHTTFLSMIHILYLWLATSCCEVSACATLFKDWTKARCLTL